MTVEPVSKWESKRTAESRIIEDALLEAGFEQVNAYRYNSASLRVRVVDSRFENMSRDDRDALVEPDLKKLPDETQSDIINLVLVSPSELDQPFFMQNTEFDNPSPSML